MSQIKRLREKAGLTQESLAKRLKVAVATIQKWENGSRVPRTTRLKAIAKVLRCEPAQLL